MRRGLGTGKVDGSGDEDSGREEPATWSGLVGVVVGVRKSDGRCKSTGYFVNWVFCDYGFWIWFVSCCCRGKVCN
jgi:hypothetical protein